MSLLGDTSMESPQQQHQVYAANDLQWIAGEWVTLGNPHNYINQDGMDFLSISEAEIAPWSFT
ncbi:MAG: hypothetical protein ACP5JG_01905, partial [Anaerolineae bacterium]